MPAHMTFRDKLNIFKETVEANVDLIAARNRKVTPETWNKEDEKTKKLIPPYSSRELALMHHSDRMYGGGMIPFSALGDHQKARMQKRREHHFSTYDETRQWLDLFAPGVGNGMVKVSRSEWETYLRPGGITDTDLRKVFAVAGSEVCVVMRNSNSTEMKRIEWHQEKLKTVSSSFDVKKSIYNDNVLRNVDSKAGFFSRTFGKLKAGIDANASTDIKDVGKWHIIWSAA